MERYYYYRLFGIVAFPLGLLHRDTWWTVSVERIRRIAENSLQKKGRNNRSCTVRWITMRDKLSLMADDYSSSAIMYKSQNDIKIVQQLFGILLHDISDNFKYFRAFTTFSLIALNQ